MNYKLFDEPLSSIRDGKVVINTINAHSYNVAKLDAVFRKALKNSDALLPDGISMVYASWFLKGKRLRKIAGADLFHYEMDRINQNGLKGFFLGSTEGTLRKIVEKAQIEYPNAVLAVYSPPYKNEFTIEENKNMVNLINNFRPDVLFIGMTAPKQEKWAYKHKDVLNVGHICSIGAVFDFYAGNIRRAPHWMIKCGLEWFYRLLVEPRRMWRRYLVGNMLFINSILTEKFIGSK